MNSPTVLVTGATGTRARDIADFARDHADAFTQE